MTRDDGNGFWPQPLCWRQSAAGPWPKSNMGATLGIVMRATASTPSNAGLTTGIIAANIVIETTMGTATTRDTGAGAGIVITTTTTIAATITGIATGIATERFF